IGNPPMNFLSTSIIRQNGHFGSQLGSHVLDAPAALSGYAGRSLVAGIRAENIRADTTKPSESALPARVGGVEELCAQLMVPVSVGDQLLKLLTNNDFPVSENGELWVTLVPEKIHWFDPDTQEEVPVHDVAVS